MKNILDKIRAVPLKVWLIAGGAVVCAVAILLGCLFLIPGGDTDVDAPVDNPTPGTTAPIVNNNTTEAVVTVTNRANAPVADAQVYVYEDDTLSELVTFAKTDAEGKATLQLTGSGNVATIKGVAPGYKLEESYPLSDNTTIVLDALASYDTPPADAKFELGAPMMDFTVTDLDGNTYTASEILKEKKALVLNFWFTTCGPCASEFPYLQKAYDTHKDSVAMLAMDPYDSDDAAAITAFRKQHELTFPMVDADPSWASLLNLTAYPTTVVIDRYGFVAFYHVGSVTEDGMFESLFAHYAAEDYEQTITDDFADVIVPEEPKEDEDGLIYDNKDEPIEFGGTLTFEAKIPAGKTTYYDIYRVSGTELTLKADNVTVEYEGKTYEPKNGVIVFPVSTDDVTIPVKLAITNTGDETATYTVNFVYPGGTLANPYVLQMGNFTTDIAQGNDQGVYYEHVVAQDGTIEMYVDSITKGVKYGFSLCNLNTSAMRNSDADAVTDGKKQVVSIEVKKGDVLQVVVSTLPDEKHEYPAATIKSYINYVGGTTAPQGPTTTIPHGGTTASKTESTTTTTGSTAPQTETYKVTVKAEGQGLANVKLTMTSANKSKKVVTSSKGVATADLPVGTCTVVLTCPDGYIAEKLQYTVDSTNPTLVIELTKEEELSTDVGDQMVNYSVKVVDGAGKGQKDISVSFLLGDKTVETVKTDKSGVASVKMLDGTYVVKLDGTTKKYDEKAAVVSVANPSIEILLAEMRGDTMERITCPIVNAFRGAYPVKEGATYVPLIPGERNYYLFTPTRDGVYRITTTGTQAKVGYYGGSIHYISASDLAEDLENNAYTVTAKEIGPTFIIGVDASTNAEATVLMITRVGDPGWTIGDEPWETYNGTHKPKTYTLPAGTNLTNMDITKSYKLVYNPDDGFYHKDTKNGPLVYLRFGAKAPYVSFADILSNFHVGAYLYDGAGNYLKKEEYTMCMEAYNACADTTETVYPLTKDLEYILKSYGKHQGWWDMESPGYLFKDAEGNQITNINVDCAWMFALCYAD